MAAAFQIGRDGNNHVRVEAVGPVPEVDFFEVTVRVAGGAFAGAFRTTLVAGDLAEFRDGLRALHEQLAGTATLTGDYDQALQIAVTGDGRGHLEALCNATDDRALGARLRFSIAFDQTELPETLAGLDSVLAVGAAHGLV